MKILQIVTYISPDGAYGGPVRVALNQAKALRDQGHDVNVAAAAGGFVGALPQIFDGFPVQLFPGHRVVPRAGFAGLISPKLLRWLPGAMRDADVIHVHLARDFITLPCAALALLMGKPLVLQTHGMIDSSNKLLARPLDFVLTRPVLRNANSVLYLTDKERADLQDVTGPFRDLQHLPNGVFVDSEIDKLGAFNHTEEPEVLFLARLHSRKRPVEFVKAAEALLSAGTKATFSIVGPDEGEAQSVRRAITSTKFSGKIIYEGALEPHATHKRLTKCDIYVLPSVNEPFPMSVIEAMAAGKPVVITKTCGLAPFVQSEKAGIVVDHEVQSLEKAIGAIIRDPAEREAMGERARKLVSREFDVYAVTRKLLNVYAQM